MQKLFFSTLLPFVLCLQAIAASAKTKNEILKQLNLSEGQYEVVVPKDKAGSFCENEILKIELLEDKDSLFLQVGTPLIFPQINIPTVSYESNVNCKTTQTSQIEDKKLTLSLREVCGKAQTKSEDKVFKFEFKNDQIELSRQEGSQTTFCSYKKIKINSKGK